MNSAALIDRLERMLTILPSLVAGVPADEATWKPASGAWSILEVVRHLADEDILDFGARLRLTLESPGTTWPRTDPEAWARDDRYNEGDLTTAVEKFVTARRNSIAWLRSLRNPDWTMTYHHPRVGPLSAGMLLACWPAHDALHIRQIAKRMFELTARDAPEHSLDYAGEWKA